MSVAVILGVIIFALTLMFCGFIGFANGMSDGMVGIPILPYFISGTILALLVVATHFLPLLHIGW